MRLETVEKWPSAVLPANSQSSRTPKVRSGCSFAGALHLAIFEQFLIKLLILVLFLALPMRLYADSDYKAYCGGCHGENAGGGFGPKLAGITIDKDDFKKLVRSGRGMMPAITVGDVSDKDIDEIYEELAAMSVGLPADKSFFATVSGWLKDNLRLVAWSAVVLSLAGMFLVLVTRYIKWSAFFDGWRYFKLVGLGKFLSIILRVFFIDALGVGALYKKDKIRWLIHGLIIYGFLGLIAADVLISIFNPERAAMPLFSPLKIFANLCGVAFLAGLFIVVYRFFTDPYENNGITLFGDIVFLILLLIVVLSGFAMEAARYLKLTQYTQYVYFAHIVFIIFLFITAPFTRFIHIVSTVFFVITTKLADAVAEGGFANEFNEESAPGRHFKSERIAKDLFGPETRIRYFP